MAIIYGQKPPIVGAIRWDACCAPLSPVGFAVETALSPQQFHYRVPFYGKEISADSIQCRATTQAIMNKEIAFAKYAGIDYWAFCWYPKGSGMDTALNLYLTNKHNHTIKWCLIVGTAPFNTSTDGVWLVRAFKQSNYQKVLHKNPLLYIWNEGFTSKDAEALQQLNLAAGNDSIYFVAMGEDAQKINQYAANIGAAAISAYTTWVYNNGGAYAPLVPEADKQRWEEHKATGRQVIPWVTTGRNTLPRIKHQVWWTHVNSAHYTQDASAKAIAAHVQDAVDWVHAHPTCTLANTILLYAWNEFDEGAWLCPTLGNNTERIKALRKVLRH